MADQCIVCLDNLDVSTPEDSDVHYLEGRQADEVVDATTTTFKPSNDSPPQNISKIKPCDHVLHDECLRAWTQKANSCPICRQTFNLVEVYDKVGGKSSRQQNFLVYPSFGGFLLTNLIGNLLSEYVVEDKKQVAEFDPSAWIDDSVEEEETTPCPICGSSDQEEVLLLCDACDAPYHTHCVGLDGVPHTNWYCMECENDGAGANAREIASVGGTSSRPLRHARSATRRPPRTQAQVRRVRRHARADNWQGTWSLIAGRVWDSLNIDLDYDNGDDDLSFAPDYRRGQREAQRWQQRMDIAARQGARDVFLEAAQPMIRPREEPAAPVETAEETKAWGAFEKAKEMDTTPPSRKRKSRSVTKSPTEAQPEPERKLKRPRTRRVIADRPGSSSDASAGSSSRRNTHTPVEPSSRTRPVVDTTAGPSFLNSLLKEVETSGASDSDGRFHNTSTTATSPTIEHSSPAASPTSSTYATPRAMSATPPPHVAKRPGSPMPLTSHVQPAFLPAPTIYAGSRILEANKEPTSPTSLEVRQPRSLKRRRSHPSSDETSPNRPAQMSTEAKAEVSSLVRKALTPHWKTKEITKQQYEDINRGVSRILYEQIQPDKLDEDGMREWKVIAESEVKRAVEGLKT